MLVLWLIFLLHKRVFQSRMHVCLHSPFPFIFFSPTPKKKKKRHGHFYDTLFLFILGWRIYFFFLSKTHACLHFTARYYSQEPLSFPKAPNAPSPPLKLASGFWGIFFKIARGLLCMGAFLSPWIPCLSSLQPSSSGFDSLDRLN